MPIPKHSSMPLSKRTYCWRLATEGMRPFDIRRWRKIHDIWGGGKSSDGLTFYDTNGTRIRDEFKKNAPNSISKRNYIYQIPENERNRNESDSEYSVEISNYHKVH